MLSTIIVASVIAVAFAAIVVNEIKKRKNGQGGCSCGGNCGICGGSCMARKRE